jgi:diguanylate cyclase (GGDEF)-like protein
VVSDALADSRRLCPDNAPEGVHFLAAVTLVGPDAVPLGSLAVMDTASRTLTDDQARMLTLLAGVMADHLALRANARRVAFLHVELQQHHGWMLESAAQDSLTQLANRRALMGFLDKTLSLARREGHAVSVLLFDVVGFKNINQRHGDAAGDRVLSEVATRLAACARGSELVGRMAGDEFMAVLYPCAADQAQLAVGRFARSITEQPVALGAASGLAVELQVAASHVTVDDGSTQTSDELYRRAAQLLDATKANAN